MAVIIKKLLGYLTNCFILLIPIFIWNIALAGKLPEPFQMQNFWRNIPSAIGLPENILRLIVFIFPLLLKLEIKEPRQKIGLIIYLIGISIYFLSWIMQIYFPQSAWSQSVFGFMAPAYTTIIWLVGIGLIGQSLFLKIPYHYSIYLVFAAFFTTFHSIHTYIVYSRL